MQRLNVAMIMDGNRRWAKDRNLPSYKGHEYGAEKIKDVLNYAKKNNWKSLTLFTFSTDNFNRDQKEIEFIFKLFVKYFKDLKNEIQKIGDTKIRFLGRIQLFPEEIQIICKEIEELTKNNSEYILQFCFGYGGRLEIEDAIKNIVDKGYSKEEITQDLIKENLYSDIEPDIVIRTSGEKRLSNFLTFQSVYSEWFFLDVHWPSITNQDLDKVIAEFNLRERRLGK